MTKLKKISLEDVLKIRSMRVKHKTISKIAAPLKWSKRETNQVSLQMKIPNENYVEDGTRDEPFAFFTKVQLSCRLAYQKHGYNWNYYPSKNKDTVTGQI